MRVKDYDLFLDINFKDLMYKGKVLIDLESEDNVILNSSGLQILNIRTGCRDLPFEYRNEELIVKTRSFKGILEIDYTGVVKDSLVGIYKAPYDGTYILSTHLEPAHARRMLPCIDHPGYKAEFKITVRVDRNLKVISNMPSESEKVEGDKRIVVFQKTPKMSTYLLYLGVGRFEESYEKWKDISIIVATRPGTGGKSAFAIEIAKKSLEFFEHYFGIPYQLPKLHLITVPEFSALAMENWGAVTFREVGLHVDAKSDFRTKKRVAEVVAHELAHMWYGNLVTMRWWNDLWLNESVATFISHKVLERLYPRWLTWQDFVSTRTAGALGRDGLKSTHPIEADVQSPVEIEQIFDEISYGKGASILRMIEAYMGLKEFQRGVSNFLTRYSYSNAKSKDLWGCLEETSGKQVHKVMRRWIKKAGYPVVTVKEVRGMLRMVQKRFLLSGDWKKEVWPIPVVMKINGREEKYLFNKREMVIGKKQVKSLKVNADQTGFYRVYYRGLYDKVWKSSLSVFDKWGIISDALAFLVAGKMPLTEYLNLVRRYFREHAYLPIYEVSHQLLLLYMISPSIFSSIFQEYHRAQLRLLEKKRDENSSMLQGIIAGRLSRVDASYAKHLGRKFHRYTTVLPDMREAVAVAYARAYEDYDGMLKRYRESNSDEEKTRFLGALTSFQNPSLVALSLGYALSGEVKRQDIGSMIITATMNPPAQDIVWQWMKVNIDKLIKLYEGTGTLSRILLSAVPFLGLGRVQEVERFLNLHRRPEIQTGIQAGLERLKIYDRMKKRLAR
ncbi:MAG: M1 family metallopeptidase, partial [Candidatus Hodarchaeota archaeon]